MTEPIEEAAGRPVSRETLDRLQLYAQLLRAEAQRQNLISASTIDQLWDRHILDSAQLVQWEPRAGAAWTDVGSGAGLPGIVIACLVKGPVTLVEPRKLRAEFLKEVVRRLSLNAKVLCHKVEKVEGAFDVITARAVASLPKLLGLCSQMSTGKTTWILPKGRSAQSELEEAQRSWQGVFHVEQSVTDVDAKIIVATGVRAKKQ